MGYKLETHVFLLCKKYDILKVWRLVVSEKLCRMEFPSIQRFSLFWDKIIAASLFISGIGPLLSTIQPVIISRAYYLVLMWITWYQDSGLLPFPSDIFFSAKVLFLFIDTYIFQISCPSLSIDYEYFPGFSLLFVEPGLSSKFFQ